MTKNTNNHHLKFDIEYDANEVGLMLANMPHPQITADAKKRIGIHLQRSLPSIITKRSRIICFPAQSALQLTASLAVFILIIYQFGIPIVTHTDALEQLLPLERIEELKEVEFTPIVFL